MTELMKTFDLLDKDVLLMFIYKPAPLTLYIIRRLYADNQTVGECRVSPNSTFTLHHPYIHFFIVSVRVSTMTVFFILIVRQIIGALKMCRVNVE